MTQKKTSPLVKGLGTVVVLVLAALGYVKFGDNGAPAQTTPGATAPATAVEKTSPPRQATPENPPSNQAPAINTPANNAPRQAMVRGPSGPLDIAATLERIERGEKHPHRNDGSVFQNREGRLPKQRRGYYREYVHPTPGQRGPGAQRVILGDADEVFYTPDHYKSFQRVSWTLNRKQ